MSYATALAVSVAMSVEVSNDSTFFTVPNLSDCIRIYLSLSFFFRAQQLHLRSFRIGGSGAIVLITDFLHACRML